MPTFLDKRFNQFVGYINEAISNDLPREIFFCGRTIKFKEGESDNLSQLLTVYLDGKETPYGLEDSLEAKARLAKDGYLGNELIAMGTRALAQVEARKKRERVQGLFEGMREIWGDYASSVWHMKIPETRRPKIAKAVLALIAVPASKEAKTVAQAKKAGAKLPWLEPKEWSTVKRVAERLRGIRK